MSEATGGEVGVHYRVSRQRGGWELSEETMPESVLHDEVVALLRAILARWAATVGGVHVARNLAVRWDEARPAIGVDPDVSVFRPAPPGAADVRSIRTWLAGHTAPALAIEVVSETNPHNDYVLAPDKYAASGTGELWIFDPLLAGPAAHGGPFPLQVWTRRDDGDLLRVYAGPGPARSPALGAWLVVVDEGRRLRISDDEEATRFWMTSEESERAAKESERAAKESERVAKETALAALERERTAKDAALARVAALEAALVEARKA